MQSLFLLIFLTSFCCGLLLVAPFERKARKRRGRPACLMLQDMEDVR